MKGCKWKAGSGKYKETILECNPIIFHCLLELAFKITSPFVARALYYLASKFLSN